MSPLLSQATDVLRPGASADAPVRIADLEILIGNLLRAITPLAGIALFIIIILAGYKFITSEGDPKKVGEARSTLTMALAGITLIALAYLILRILATLTGNNTILDFQIYR